MILTAGKILCPPPCVWKDQGCLGIITLDGAIERWKNVIHEKLGVLIMNGPGLLQGQYWAKSRKKCVRREREGNIQRDWLGRSHHYRVRVGSEGRNAHRWIHKSVIINDSLAKNAFQCTPDANWFKCLQGIVCSQSDLPYFSASHMNTSLEPEVVLLTWRPGECENFLGDLNCQKRLST